jgi:hypothetical protein
MEIHYKGLVAKVPESIIENGKIIDNINGFTAEFNNNTTARIENNCNKWYVVEPDGNHEIQILTTTP